MQCTVGRPLCEVSSHTSQRRKEEGSRQVRRAGMSTGLGEIRDDLNGTSPFLSFSPYFYVLYAEHVPSQHAIFQNKIEKGEKKIVAPVYLSVTRLAWI